MMRFTLRRQKTLDLCIAAWVLGLIFCVGASLSFSRQKPLWMDEVHGLQASSRGASWTELFFRGTHGQASPAPLYYMFLKTFDGLSPLLDRWTVPATIYMRWTALGPMVLGAFLLVRLRPSRVPRGLAIVGSLFFLLAKENFYYMSEARPYALWVLGTLLLLLACWRLFDRWYWAPVFAFTGATATASFFQIAAMALAVIAVSRWPQARWPNSAKMWIAVGAGLAISCYYMMHAVDWGWPAPAWGVFGRFIGGYKWAIAGSLFWCVMAWRERQMGELATALTIMLWFLMGPVIFFLTRQKGFFFSDRQYIYWVTATLFVVLGLGRWLLDRRLQHGRSFWRQKSNGLAFVLLLLSLKKLGVHHTARWINGAMLNHAFSVSRWF